MKSTVPPQEVNSTLIGFNISGKLMSVAIAVGFALFLLLLPQKSDAGINFNGNPSDPGYPEISVVTWVYLEGAMIDPGGSQTYSLPMRTTLNSLQFLPGQTFHHLLSGNVYNPAGQPYLKVPWLHSGTEGAPYNSNGNPVPGTANYPSTVVDWVLVSLRETPDGIPLCSKAALLHNDGHVEMVDGGFSCPGLDSDAYYLVIEHRNHLIVMSDHPVPVRAGRLAYDFRYTQSYIASSRYGGYGQKEIPGMAGTYAMYAGNGEQNLGSFSDTDINFDDRSYWGTMNGSDGNYNNGDYNLSGDCNMNDLITWEYNNAVFSTVPRD
jgi:hypothetical protein